MPVSDRTPGAESIAQRRAPPHGSIASERTPFPSRDPMRYNVGDAGKVARHSVWR
jgi:hypothetical protein